MAERSARRRVRPLGIPRQARGKLASHNRGALIQQRIDAQEIFAGNEDVQEQQDGQPVDKAFSDFEFRSLDFAQRILLPKDPDLALQRHPGGAKIRMVYCSIASIIRHDAAVPYTYIDPNIGDRYA